jgi:hypothetical protein
MSLKKCGKQKYRAIIIIIIIIIIMSQQSDLLNAYEA